jgi:hypothetical protein
MVLSFFRIVLFIELVLNLLPVYVGTSQVLRFDKPLLPHHTDKSGKERIL